MKTSKKDQKTKQAILDSLAKIFEKLSVEDALKVEAYALILNECLSEIPNEPPELYRERTDKKESPVDFVARVYGEYLGCGLAKVDLKYLDKSLYNALNNWATENGALPGSFGLPTRKQQTNLKLQKLRKIHSPSVPGRATSWEDIGQQFVHLSWNVRDRRSLEK